MDSRWLKQWERYVGYDNYHSGERGQEADFPGPIDNSNLFKGIYIYIYTYNHWVYFIVISSSH